MASSSAFLALRSASDWWDEVNNSSLWQDRIFHALSLLFGLISVVALIQLVRIECRVPEFGWTTQKVFHFLNFFVNGVRSLVFVFRRGIQKINPVIIQHILLDLPGLAFFTTYALLVLFWAEIYYQARSVSTDGLRPSFYTINAVVYVIQISLWLVLWWKPVQAMIILSKLFFAGVSFFAALGFLLYGGRLFLMLKRFPVESKGRRKKLQEVGYVTTICFLCFLLRCIMICFNTFDKAADLDVLDHPILNFIYYLLRIYLSTSRIWICDHEVVIDRCPLFPAEKSLRSSEMESDGGHEAIRPVTAEEEAVKRNTDCVYFLASPLTCKKPLDSCFTMPAPVTTSRPIPPQTAATSNPAACAPPGNINKQLPGNVGKQGVPCYYFQWGQCLKGEKCPFMHGPQASSSAVSQHNATTSAYLAEPPQTSKKGTQQNTSLQWTVAELDKSKVAVNMPVEMPPAAAKIVTKAGNVINNEPSANKLLPPYSLNDEPSLLPQITLSVGSGYTLSQPWSHQVQPWHEKPENVRDTDEFLREHSPGFDVLVEDDSSHPDYFHNEDNFRRVSAHDGQKLEPEDDYDNHHRHYEPMTKFDRDRYNAIGKDDNYENCGLEPKTFDRNLGKPSSLERRVRDSEKKLDEADGSDLRHQLLKQRRLTGSGSTESPHGRHEHHRRDDRHAEERGYGRHSRDQRQLPVKSSISTRLQGRITFPGRSSIERASDLHLEKERGRRPGGRLSPTRQITYQLRHLERIRQQQSEDFNKDTRNTRNKPTRRDDTNSLDFVGPKSLAELKGAKITGSSDVQSITSTVTNTKLNKENSGKVEGLQESENSPSFEGPKPLSVILKRKRESAYVDSEISTCPYENNIGGGESAINSSAQAAVVNLPPVALPEVEKEGNYRIDHDETHEVKAVEEEVQEEEEEGMIPPEDKELNYNDQSSAKAGAVEAEDGMDLENVEDEELENYDQRDEDFEYEAGGAEDGENTFQDDDDEFDDEDDFARKVSVMLS
ncbi:hypothetical protein C4D60_Mb01t20750 [Musa balbisiana]|uniref:C3H1-type domain-containing protein n=1 Tax=Musa balbisiana TaxID=52838 RepID=A0A4S8JNM8_MUSBA|nr:hypothetical protein C4D60_Mb01t20750 [Musa balbisiana]